MTIALVTTGGTIVSQADQGTGLAAPAMGGQALLAAVARFGETGQVEVIDALRVSSPQIGTEDWRALHATIQSLLDRDDIRGVVVTHGTATLEETAWFLDLTLASAKPVVITGAQRNASEPDTDGPRNLFNAIRICEAAFGVQSGVMVALNDSIHAAREVAKTQTLNVETFNSGAWGSLGHVRAGRVIFHRKPLRRVHVPLQDAPLPQVVIIPMYVGATGDLLRAAVQMGVKGIVLEAIASGHVNEALYGAACEALTKAVPILVSTRIPAGGTRIGYSFPGSSHSLVEKGAVLSDDLSPWKARILMMLALQNGWRSQEALRALFSDETVPE